MLLIRHLLSFSVLCAVVGASGFAASPALSIVQPRGAQRGTEAVLLLNGARLTDAQEVMPYYPGITVKSIEVVNDNQVKANVVIASDCRLGEHAFRVRTASGISDLRTFWVGALPSVNEVEPNSEFESPQSVPLNSTVHGTIGGEDVDYYVVECKKDQRLSIEVEGIRLGESFWDPYIAILDSRRFEMVYSDDSPMIAQDAGCSVKIPADGKYIVQIRESAFGGGSSYRLHIGNFPRPIGVLPLGGKPGEEVDVTFFGDPLGDIKQKVKLPATADPMFRLHCVTAEGVSPSGFHFHLTDLPRAAFSIANTTPQTAQVVTAPGMAGGQLAKPGQSNYFKFAAKKGQVFDIRCFAREVGSPLDSVMTLVGWDGKNTGGAIASNDDSGGLDSYFRVTIPNDQEYMLIIRDQLNKGGVEYYYHVEISPVSAITRTGIPKVNGNNVSDQTRQVIAVPKGNRFATMVNVNRADWGGVAVIGLDKAPVGMSIVAEPVEAGLASVPVVFEAKADAPVAGLLADLQAKPADTKVAAASETNLDVNFAIGLNNTPFHRLMTDRVAVAVTETAPFSIEVLEPKAPVPQRGSLNLKIVAKRQPGFTKPITIYPLFTPPGLGIAGSATIPENGTEATLYTNAAPNAAPRKWKTAVIAVADAGKGPVWVSSQLFTLEVAVPFVTFAQERSAVEQGQKAPVFGKITVNTPFEGEATVKLLGLPAKATAPDLKLTKGSTELSFEVTTDKTTPAGKHSVFCQVDIVQNGEVLTHTIGGAELRVDVPLPPKVTPAPTATAQAKPATPPPAAKPAKPLSRLEQLRLEQAEREKAAKAGAPAPASTPKK